MGVCLMSLFKRKEKPKIETELGTFEYDGEWWSAETQTQLGEFTIASVTKEFDASITLKLKEIIEQLPAINEKALTYIEADNPAILTEHGKLTPHLLDVTDLLKDETFAIEYLFENWVDAGLTVIFKNGQPSEYCVVD